MKYLCRDLTPDDVRDALQFEMETNKKNRFGLKKKSKPPRAAAQRYAVLSVRTPGLHPRKRKHHILQTVKTKSVEDDSTPEWNLNFGGADHSTNIWTYAASEKLTVEVFDEANAKQGAELVGKGDLEMDGGMLTELDVPMDGGANVLWAL